MNPFPLTRTWALAAISALVIASANIHAVASPLRTASAPRSSIENFQQQAIVPAVWRFVGPYMPRFSARANRIVSHNPLHLHDVSLGTDVPDLPESDQEPELQLLHTREQTLKDIAALGVTLPNPRWIRTVYLQDALLILQRFARHNPESIRGLTLRMPWKMLAGFQAGGLAGFYRSMDHSQRVVPLQSRAAFQYVFAHELGHAVMARNPETFAKFRAISWSPLSHASRSTRMWVYLQNAATLYLAGESLLSVILAYITPYWTPSLLYLASFFSVGFLVSMAAGGSTGALFLHWVGFREAYIANTVRPWSFLTVYSLVSADEEAAELLATWMVYPAELKEKAKRNPELAQKIDLFKRELFNHDDFSDPLEPALERNGFVGGWPGIRGTVWVIMATGLAVFLQGSTLSIPMMALRVIGGYYFYSALLLYGFRPVLALRVHLARVVHAIDDRVKQVVRTAIVTPVQMVFEMQRLAIVAYLLTGLIAIIDPSLLHIKLFDRPIQPELVETVNGRATAQSPRSILQSLKEAVTSTQQALQTGAEQVEAIFVPIPSAKPTPAEAEKPSIKVFYVNSLSQLPSASAKPSEVMVEQKGPNHLVFDPIEYYYDLDGNSETQDRVQIIDPKTRRPVVNYPFSVSGYNAHTKGVISFQFESIPLTDIESIELVTKDSRRIEGHSLWSSMTRLIESSPERDFQTHMLLRGDGNRLSQEGSSIRLSLDQHHAYVDQIYNAYGATVTGGNIYFYPSERTLFTTNPRFVQLVVHLKDDAKGDYSNRKDVAAREVRMPPDAVKPSFTGGWTWTFESTVRKKFLTRYDFEMKSPQEIFSINLDAFDEAYLKFGPRNRVIDFAAYDKIVLEVTSDPGWMEFTVEAYKSHSLGRFYLPGGKHRIEIDPKKLPFKCPSGGCEVWRLVLNVGKEAGEGNPKPLHLVVDKMDFIAHLDVWRNVLPGLVAGPLVMAFAALAGWHGMPPVGTMIGMSLLGAFVNFFVHEAGHAAEARRQGIPFTVKWLPTWGLPLIPTAVRLGRAVAARQELRFLSAGTVRGGLFGLVTVAAGYLTGHPAWIATGLSALAINFFSLLPLKHSDGRRIAQLLIQKAA